MSQTNESRVVDPAIAFTSEYGLNTSKFKEFHLSPQPKSTPISDHQRASNMLRFALTLDNTDTWLGMIQVLKARLSSRELAALSFVALKAQRPEDAAATVKAALDLNCMVAS